MHLLVYRTGLLLFTLRNGKPGIYHRFYGETGRGKVLLGEVSAVNDDTTDNRFYERMGRFPDLIEDELPGFESCIKTGDE